MKFKLATKKILATVIILDVVVILIAASLFWVIRSKNMEISSFKNTLDGQVGIESELKFMGNNLKNTEEERNQINTYFVQQGKSGVADFVETVEDIANESDVVFSFNSISLEDTETAVQKMNVGIEIQGSWYKTIYFIRLLENSPYKISFQRVYIEKDKDDYSWSSVLNLSVLKLTDN